MISFRPARSAVNPSMAGWLFLRAWVGNNAGRGTLICRMSPPSLCAIRFSAAFNGFPYAAYAMLPKATQN
eukprot:12896485-Prorocentrum_lima.AAC.1